VAKGFFEVWELDLRCWGPLRRAHAPLTAFPADSVTSDNFSSWFSAAPTTVAPRATDCSFFSFSFVFGVCFVVWVCFSDVIRAFLYFWVCISVGFGCFWADLGECWGFLGFVFLVVLGVVGAACGF
jgi:hypothetical protein